MRILVVGDVHGNTDFMRTAIVGAVPKLSRWWAYRDDVGTGDRTSDQIGSRAIAFVHGDSTTQT
jgi:hypothetical protein